MKGEYGGLGKKIPHDHGIEHLLCACAWICSEDWGNGKKEGCIDDLKFGLRYVRVLEALYGMILRERYFAF